MRTMSFESVGIIEPGCPARPAAARFRRASVGPILTPVSLLRPMLLIRMLVIR